LAERMASILKEFEARQLEVDEDEQLEVVEEQEEGKRGVLAPDASWSWDKPFPMPEGCSPEKFPPFQSFTAEDLSLEEELVCILRMCAEARNGNPYVLDKPTSNDTENKGEVSKDSVAGEKASVLHLRTEIR
uniref:TESMIN n=1 Tax=Heligmosomoides polygyrus TaxID=6339 RepID=A0A183G7F5_HELPZ